MKEKQWSCEEERIRQQFKKKHDTDEPEIPELDKSYMFDNEQITQRKSRFNKFAQIAAVLLLMAASSMVTAIFITNGYVDAFKGAIDKKIFSWNTGVNISNDDSDSNEVETWEITDANLILEIKNIFDGLMLTDIYPIVIALTK